MSDNLRSFGQTFLKLHEELERNSRSLTSSYMTFYKQMEQALEPVRRLHMEVTRTAALPELASSRLGEIVKANQHWQDMINQPTASSRITRMHETWLRGLKPVQDHIAQIQAAAKLSLGGVAYQLTITEQMFAGLDFEAIRRSVPLLEPTILKFRDAIGDVTSTYRKLADSIRTYPDVTHLPAFALPGATREVFVTGYALDTIHIPDGADTEQDSPQVQLVVKVEEETSGCVALLQAVDPALAKPYIGAHDALRSRSADRARHVLSSLRELWGHLLHRIAPEEHVLSWVPGKDKKLIHEGRPTRRAHILYVCRSLNHEPLSEFVVQDTNALVKLLEFFNRVHELEPGLTDDQLRALLLRTDSWLMYILQIWR